MADILNKRNKIHHLDNETDEDMFPLFAQDVDGKPRNNKRLLPRKFFLSHSASGWMINSVLIRSELRYYITLRSWPKCSARAKHKKGAD